MVGRLRMRGMMLFQLILLISSQGEASQQQGVYKRRFYLPYTLSYQSRYSQLIKWSVMKPYQLRVSKDLVTIVGTLVVLSMFLQCLIPIRLVELRYVNKFNILQCIDAHNYQNRGSIFTEVQFTQAEVIHEMTKAFVGFNVPGNECISTGRWGCGVFQGDWQLKLLVQMIAASAAGCKKMVYYNTDEGVKETLDEFLSNLRMI